MAQLVIKSGFNDTTFEFTQDQTIIGRSAGNTLQIKDIKVSRRHCQIIKVPEGYKIIDLGSSNGTSVNNEKIHDRLLNDKDRIRIGDAEIIFNYPEGSPQEVSPGVVTFQDLSEEVKVAPAEVTAPAAVVEIEEITASPKETISEIKLEPLETVTEPFGDDPFLEIPEVPMESPVKSSDVKPVSPPLFPQKEVNQPQPTPKFSDTESDKEFGGQTTMIVLPKKSPATKYSKPAKFSKRSFRPSPTTRGRSALLDKKRPTSRFKTGKNNEDENDQAYEKETPKKSSAPIIIGVVVVVLAAIILIVTMGGPNKTDNDRGALNDFKATVEQINTAKAGGDYSTAFAIGNDFINNTKSKKYRDRMRKILDELKEPQPAAEDTSKE